MEKLTYFDIKERQNHLNSSSYTSNTAGVSIDYLFENLGERYSFNNAKLILENWRYLSESEIEAFDKALETFLIICGNDTDQNIKKAASIIEGRIIHKVRDGKATRHLNNYKLGKFKISNTKINNRIKDAENTVSNTMKNKGNVVNIFHPHRKYDYDIYGKRRSGEKKQTTKKEDEKKEETVEECFNSFLEISMKNDQCDRILENHQKLSKRYNLDNKVRSCRLDRDSLVDCIYELCQIIDTYESADSIKYAIALENINYLMHKNCINIEDSVIAEAVSDYFLLSREEINDDFLKDISYILNNTKFYDENDLCLVEYLYKDPEEYEEIEVLNSFDTLDSMLENGKDRIEMRKALMKDKRSKTVKKIKKKIDNNNEKTKKDINNFKTKHQKTIGDFRSVIIRFFSNDKEGILRNLPDIFDIIRAALAISTFAIHPILGLIVLITSEFLKLHLKRSEAQRVLKEYDKQIARYEKKLEKTNDSKAQEKYEAVIDKFKEQRDKYAQYAKSLYSEKELDERNAQDESLDLYDIALIQQLDLLSEHMDWNQSEIMESIRNNITRLDSEDIYTLTESVILCPDAFDLKEYKHILEEARDYYRQKDTFAKYLTIDALNVCMRNLDKAHKNNITFNEDYQIDKVYQFNNYYQEVVNDTIELINSYNVLNEEFKNPLDKNKEKKNIDDPKLSKGKPTITTANNKNVKPDLKLIKKPEDKKKPTVPTVNDIKKTGINISSKLKLAQTKLQKSAADLQDKEKKLSEKIDIDMLQVQKSAEKALTNNNREAVIKGSLIPSASRCIKAAIVTGAAWLVSPALAVIGVIGAVGISKKLQKKERQLILDDIEIELQMCDKYLRIAEEKNDMKATRNILQTKRSLQRQKQRINYNMGIAFENVPKVKDSGDNVTESYVMLPNMEVL